MLEIKNLSAGYDKKKVVSNISFTIRPNEIIVLTGGNGSGKSTVLKCIYGLLPKWDNLSKVYFNNEDITWVLTSEMVKKGIVYIPQKNNYFESLTIHENLIVSGSTYTYDTIKKREDEVYKLPNLFEFRDRKPFDLSGGERQLLALGNALMHKPELILFDEPFAGLDKKNESIVREELIKLKKQNISMLIVEHLTTMNTYADKIITMKDGQII